MIHIFTLDSLKNKGEEPVFDQLSEDIFMGGAIEFVSDLIILSTLFLFICVIVDSSKSLLN